MLFLLLHQPVAFLMLLPQPLVVNAVLPLASKGVVGVRARARTM